MKTLKLVKKNCLKVETDEIIQVVKKRFPSKKVTTIKEIENAGCWNPIYQVELEKNFSLVLKIMNPTFIPKWKTLNEVNTMKMLKEFTKVPVPQIYDYGIDKKIIKYEYILMEFVDGKMMEELTSDEIKDVIPELIEIFIELKSIKFKCKGKGKIGGIKKYWKDNDGSLNIELGEMSDVLIGGPFSSYHDYVFNVVKNRMPYLEQEYQILYQKFLQTYNENSSQNIKFLNISHGDFTFENIIVKNKRVAGILDWEWAEINSYDHDISFFVEKLKDYGGEKKLKDIYDSKRIKQTKEKEIIQRIIVDGTIDILKSSCWFVDPEEHKIFLENAKKELKESFNTFFSFPKEK